MMNVRTLENRIKRLESFFGPDNATVRALRAQVRAEKAAPDRVRNSQPNLLKIVCEKF